MSETFILDFSVDGDLCDTILNEFITGRGLQYDASRQYLRFPSKQLSTDTAHAIELQVNQGLAKYYEKYSWAQPGRCILQSDYNVQQFKPGYHYNMWHIEDGGPQPNKPLRKFTWMIYLNDVMEGGETQFLYQHKAYQPCKGVGLIWPAGWTHPHRGQVAPNETKYICTGWFIYDDKG